MSRYDRQMRSPLPILRGQGNRRFATDEAGRAIQRGQEVPYHVNGAPPAATAAGTSFTPGGNIAATTVQAAIEELDTEKLAASAYTSVGAVNLHLPISGTYIDAGVIAAALTTLAGVADRFDVVPIDFARDLTFVSLDIEVTTALAGSNAKVLIYDTAADGAPGNLVVESGDISCATTGVKSFAYALSVTRGQRLWIGIRTSSTQTLRSIAPGQMRTLGRASSTASSANVLRRSLAFASAAPASYVATSADYSGPSTVLWVGLKIA